MVVTKSNGLAEIRISYSSKVKAADRFKISNSRDAYELLSNIYDANEIEHHEMFFLLLLNRSNCVLGWVKIADGGIDSVMADVRIMFQYALMANAVSIIVSHNHPSGNLRPSDADIRLTKKLAQGGEILTIELLDHIIVTSEGYYSMADNGEV